MSNFSIEIAFEQLAYSMKTNTLQTTGASLKSLFGVEFY